MPRSQRDELVEFNPENNRMLRNVCRALRFKMENNVIIHVEKTQKEHQDPSPPILLVIPPLQPPMIERTIADYDQLSITGAHSSIARPPVHCEIKTNVIQMVQNNVQFEELQEEDPNTYITNR